jgi:hypothetical protein
LDDTMVMLLVALFRAFLFGENEFHLHIPLGSLAEVSTSSRREERLILLYVKYVPTLSTIRRACMRRVEGCNSGFDEMIQRRRSKLINHDIRCCGRSN